MMYIENKEFGDTFKNKKEFERTDKNFYINRGDFTISTTNKRWEIEFKYNDLGSRVYITNSWNIPEYILDWLENDTRYCEKSYLSE